jgi:hypothetical protein
MRAETTQSTDLFLGETEGRDLSVMTGHSEEYEVDDYESLNPLASPLIMTPLAATSATGDELSSPVLNRNEYNPAAYSPGSESRESRVPPPQLLSPSPIMSKITENPTPPSSPVVKIFSPPSKTLRDNFQSPAPESPQKSVKDIVWLLQTLRYDGGASRDEKKKAIAELKRLAKSASEEYWKRNCAQV